MGSLVSGGFAGEGGVEGDAGAHGGAEGDALEIAAFGAAGFSFDDGVEGGDEVFFELFVGEVDFADGNVDDAGFVGSIFDAGGGLDFFDGVCDLVGDGAVSFIGGFGAEEASDFSDLGGHVFGGEHDVEGLPSFLDFLDEVFVADEVGTGGFGFFGEVSFGEDGDGLSFAGAVGEGGGASDVLVALAGVDAEAEAEVYGLREFGGGSFLNGGKGFVELVEFREIDFFGKGEEALAVFVFAF